MGKKGEKKGKIDASIEKSEPNLEVITEEPIETPNEEQKFKINKSRSVIKRKSILKPTTGEAEVPIIEREGRKSHVSIPETEPEEKERRNSKKEKGKKGKKEKKEQIDDQEENEDDEEERKKSVTVIEPSVPESETLINKKKGKKKSEEDKPEKKDKAEGTEEIKKKGKKGKGKKDKKVEEECKETQKDDYSDLEDEETRPISSEIRFRSSHYSRVSFHSRTLLPRRSRSIVLETMLPEEERQGHRTFRQDSSKQMLGSGRRSIKPTDSVLSTDGSGRRLKRWPSRLSEDTVSSTSSESGSARVEKEEHDKKKGKKKKDKKEKKHKGEKTEDKDEEKKESPEEHEKRKAEKEALKEAKKAELKAAKLAAKQEASTKKTKSEIAAEEYEEIRKRVEETKKLLKEMGVEVPREEKGEDKGPKKKISKKERARLTAEVAEKQRAEIEVQAKRLEELLQKKREEERLAAIETDRRDNMEQGWRIEQLKTSNALIQDIIDTNAEIARVEKELDEWQKYVECGNLPNPSMVNQMNTLLHIWGVSLEETNTEEVSKMTKDAITLLSELDDLIETATEEDQHRLANWKWVRQLFREFQASSLDVATYRLLRDVVHNLNRLNIPTANYNFKDDYFTLCVWLRVMLPIPLPNPRRPPKQRIDVLFAPMDLSAVFPPTIDCQNAAIRAMYLKYDHLSDLCDTYNMHKVPKDYYMDLLTISKKEWRTKQKYKYDNRDKRPIPVRSSEVQQQEERIISHESIEGHDKEKSEPNKISVLAEIIEPEDFASDEEIPSVPFKQLKPNAHEYAVELEDKMYSETRQNLIVNVPEHIINLRKFVILGGVYHLNLLAQSPQPQDFITMEMTLTRLSLPKKLEVLPFKVVYTPYIPPEPDLTTATSTSILARKMPDEMEAEAKKYEEELDKLISINIKWPQHVMFLELPIVCRWDDKNNYWSKEEIHDLKHNEEKFTLSFRTGVFGIYGLATYKYVNLPFQAYDIKPEINQSVTVQLTAAMLMFEFNIKDGLICITELQNSPNKTLQDIIGKYFKLHQLKRMMKDAGLDIFPAFDAFCYLDGCCEKQWAMEKHLYYNMAQMSNSFNFAWSRWNLQAGRRKIVLQMRQYSPESKKQFCADLYHLMKSTCGIFVRNKVIKASKQNVYALAQFLIATRIPVVGPNGVVQDKMSLNTLLEAAKFLEMQEQRQQHRATLESALATTTTIRQVTGISGGSGQMSNGNGGTTQTITLQPVKLINATSAPTSIASFQGHQQQPTQTVVISSNNISSTFLQGVQGPISFATATPTSISTSPQTILQNGLPQNGTTQIKKEQDGHISSTTMSQTQRHRVLNNSFDIMNPLVIDEGSPVEHKKIKQPPMVFRSGTREVHNKLEKHRRAHLKECFDILKKQLPTNGEEKKTSNLSILHSALRYIQNLKRRERELEHEMERLAREKISYQQRLATLKKDISTHFDNVDFSKILPEIPSSTTSITHNGGGAIIKRESGEGPVSTSTSSFIIPTTSVASSIGGESIKTQSPTTVVTSSDLGNASIATVVSSNTMISQTNSVIASNGESKISIPILGKMPIMTTTQATSLKEVTQPVQTTGISVLPMPYPVNQGLVLQKVAIVPHKGLTELAPLMSTTHFITTPQQLNGINGQINGKVVPLTQYIVKPMVVVSSASPRPGS